MLLLIIGLGIVVSLMYLFVSIATAPFDTAFLIYFLKNLFFFEIVNIDPGLIFFEFE